MSSVPGRPSKYLTLIHYLTGALTGWLLGDYFWLPLTLKPCHHCTLYILQFIFSISTRKGKTKYSEKLETHPKLLWKTTKSHFRQSFFYRSEQNSALTSVKNLQWQWLKNQYILISVANRTVWGIEWSSMFLIPLNHAVQPVYLFLLLATTYTPKFPHWKFATASKFKICPITVNLEAAEIIS